MARSRANTRARTKRSSTARRNAPAKRSARAKTAKALAPAEFDTALGCLNVKPPFAVAVSGGADSLALLLLTADWCKRKRAAAPLALTVDHGLRPGSSREAKRVAAWLKKRSIPHETLRWAGAKPGANVQAEAREARYRLIGERMRALGLETLLTGHTQDDQAETFLLRLARGSGLDGLAGMAPVAPYPLPAFAAIWLARPLLAFSHDRLKATLKARKQPWIEDPSNANDRFARVQIRKLMPALGQVGATRERIAAAASHLHRARGVVDEAVAALIEGAEISPWGYALVKRSAFAEAPREVGLRALARLIEAIGGGAYPPRFEQTELALEWLTEGTAKGRTLGGCRLARRGEDAVLMAREETALAQENPIVRLEPGAAALWDRRYLVTLSQDAGAGGEVRLLGSQGLKTVGPRAHLPPIEPNRIGQAAPAFWRDAHLTAVPLLGFTSGETGFSAQFIGLSRLSAG